MFRIVVLAFVIFLQTISANAWPRHGATSGGGIQTLARSQFGPNYASTTTQEWPFANLFKTNGGWTYGNGLANAKPWELDANGYLLSSAGLPTPNWSTSSGVSTRYSVPTQAEQSGNHAITWLGQGKFGLNPENFFATNGLVSCTGTGTFVGGVAFCDNTACSTFTGSIAPGPGANGTLTVTAAPTGTGCTLGPGVPVSGQISLFDTMTVITGSASTNSNLCSPSCTGAGGTGTYAVNISQTQASGTMVMGARLEISFGAVINYTNSGTGSPFQRMLLQQTATGSGIQRVTRIAAFNVNDEATYWNSATPCGKGKACIASSIFRTRAQQANFQVMRDLNWGSGNTGSCSTWSGRKPLSYATWNGSELRNAAAGNETYVAGGATYTIPKIGQYVDAGGLGASGGTVASPVSVTNASVTASITPSAAGTGSITSNVLTITVATAGTYSVGQKIIGGNGLDIPGDVYITSLGTGSGGTGTYNITPTANLTSRAMTGVAVLHVSAVNSGALVNSLPQQLVAGTGIAGGMYTLANLTAFSGDFASYSLDANTRSNLTTAVASQSGVTLTSLVFNVTLGSGAFVDKQTFTMQLPAAGNSASAISLNGTAAVPILTKAGAPLSIVTGGSFPPPLNGEVATFFYDAGLGGVAYYSGGGTTSVVGIECGGGGGGTAVPPEVSMEIAAELNEVLEHDPPYFALDPMTDWMVQHATYQNTNYPFSNLGLPTTGSNKLLGPIYEASNEPFNCPQINANYMSFKSTKYVLADPTAWNAGQFCGSNGNNYGWIGKITSTMGQDLVSVYGAGNFELAPPIQTTFPVGGNLYPALTSKQYIAQTLIAAQTGYTLTPAYNYATRISINNYWNPGLVGLGLEAGAAYCYMNYSVSSACQSAYASQAAVMTAYMNSSTASTAGYSTNNIFNRLVFTLNWKTQALICFNVTTRPGTCTVNQTFPELAYEGTFSQPTLGADLTNSITAAVNDPSITVLAVNNNGCVAGQTNAFVFVGGTWATANGSYVVQASGTDSTHCAISLNSSGLGTLSSGTVTYTGSLNYVNYLRQASYMSPDLATLTNTFYAGLNTNGLQNPSQFNLSFSGPIYGGAWLVWGSLYSGITDGTCTACTIASSTLTLGGTITGKFNPGDVLYGAINSPSQFVTGTGAGSSVNTVLGTCTPIGANACGTTAGDTFALNQTSTVPVGMRMVAVWPIPSTAWNAIRTWNGNP